MPTGLRVVLAKQAERDFDDIVNYIKHNFGSSSAVNFKNLIFNVLELISNFPEIGSLEVVEKGIRAFVGHKRLRIFYTLSEKQVIILRLFDTRQSPDKS